LKIVSLIVLEHTISICGISILSVPVVMKMQSRLESKNIMIFRIILILSITLTITACGGGSDSTPAPEQSTPESCWIYPADFIGPRKPCPAV
jgi:hypothetical protein